MSLKIGNDYYKQGLYEKALEEYENIDKDSPLYKHALFSMEYIRRKIGRGSFNITIPPTKYGKIYNSVPIVFITDNNFVIPTSVAIISLIEKKRPETYYSIYIIIDNVSDENKKRLHAFENQQVSIKIIETASDKFASLHQYDSKSCCVATISALLKFEIPNILNREDKVLYLDGDILVKSDLSNLYNINIDNYYAAVTHDTGKLYSKRFFVKSLHKTYFNSGVMLLNLKLLRQDDVPAQLIQSKQEINDMKLMDQDAFNIIFKNKVKMFGIKYNFLFLNLKRASHKYTIDQLNTLFGKSYENLEDIKEQASIIHFSSKDKPWKYINGLYSKEWYEYFLKSPFKDESLERVSLDYQMILSLTSYPARIKTVHKTVETLLEQSYKADKIILWLASDEFPNREKNLPKELLDLTKRGLTISWCENIKSYQKLIPVLKEYPNCIIVTADDDIYYQKDWLKKLHEAYTMQPNIVHCHRAHKIIFHDNKIMPYNRWKMRITNVKPSFLNFFTGVGGVLYPPNIFHRDALDKELFLRLSPKADDIWFWAMCVLNGIKINVINGNEKHLSYVEDTQSIGLFNENVAKNRNDEYIKNIFEYYPKLYDKILSCKEK
ncbi:MAG: glycosyltransferase family 8 protein [Campylobacteraceae bacterium]|nr:glycosyltransferase family 8 protein [Campylobacteraceae bacterium]